MSLSRPASPRAAEPNRMTRCGWKCATIPSSNSRGMIAVAMRNLSVLRGSPKWRSCRRGAGDGALDQCVEVGGNGVNRLLELGEGPPAERAEIVDARHPIGVHRVRLVLGVLAAVALDLDDEVQEVVLPVSVIHSHDEIGQVSLWGGAEQIRHLE